ncbi:unnamed protein product, partial [Brassica oleracea]
IENSHLKTAQDQVAKGGYSIILKPEDSSSAAWFITRTVERYITIYISQVIPKKIEKSKDCREDAAERYGEAGKQKRDVRIVQLGLAKKIKNGTSKIVLEKVKEARAAALYALKEHMPWTSKL